jgi:uncharacterized coiled-coil protein SlyX
VDKTGDIYSLSYAQFVVPLVKAVQEQQKMIEQLQSEVEYLKGQLEQQKSTTASKEK